MPKVEYDYDEERLIYSNTSTLEYAIAVGLEGLISEIRAYCSNAYGVSGEDEAALMDKYVTRIAEMVMGILV